MLSMFCFPYQIILYSMFVLYIICFSPVSFFIMPQEPYHALSKGICDPILFNVMLPYQIIPHLIISDHILSLFVTLYLSFIYYICHIISTYPNSLHPISPCAEAVACVFVLHHPS